MNRAELVKTLELVKPALAVNNMIPIFQCFTFGSGTVLSYNDTIAILGPCEIESGIGIHGNTLLGLLSNSKAETVELFLERDTAVFKLGKTISKLPFQSEENFLFELPKDDWEFKLQVTESFIEALKLCLETVSSDTTQAALLGITLENDLMYSCNGDCLTRIKLKNKAKSRVLMPTAFCETIVKLWSSLTMTGGFLRFNTEWVYADFGAWNVYGRILEINEPIDFAQLIKRTVKGEFPPCYPFPEGFSGALSRARVLADPESQKTIVTIAKNKMTLLTETHMGEIKDDFKLEGHPDVIANINASHLQNALGSCIEMAVLEKCIILEAPDVFKLVSNMS